MRQVLLPKYAGNFPNKSRDHWQRNPLSDDGERETVKQVADLLEQITTTFDPENKLDVKAFGHMGFADWDKKTGCYQNVNIAVETQVP